MSETNTDLEHIDPVGLGRSLKGLGLNLLVTDVGAAVAFLCDVFGMRAFQPTDDFAILQVGETVLQVHADHTYHSNPLLSLLPESGPRGGGLELRLYACDPDDAVAAVQGRDGVTVLQEARNKPHGLREAYILDREGYCWVPSRPLSDEEVRELDA